MAEQAGQHGSTLGAVGASPSPAELLRAALEKIVFFEWRLGEIAAELAAAQTRASNAEAERARTEEQARAAHAQAQAARLSLADLEADRARLAALLARPAHASQAAADSGAALEAERARSAQLAAQLDGARRENDRHRAERDRWLNEMIEQARSGGESPAALAEFISELRGEVLALREREKVLEGSLGAAKVALPPARVSPSHPPPAHREDSAVEEARALWAQGRLGSAEAEVDRSRAAAPSPAAAAGSQREGAAARALAEQCLRGLQSADPARRAQAADHLAAVPGASAAPALAHAIGSESDPRAKAAMVRALVACGGEGAAEIASGLLSSGESPLVRMSAVEALALPGGDRARAALEAGARDPSAAVRRRTVALLLGSGEHPDLLASLSADADRSVRAACAAGSATAGREAPRAPEPVRAVPVQARAAPAAARDLAAEALSVCRAAIFGLTEAELAEALSLESGAAAELVDRLVSAGRLGRRGKRLVARGEALASGEERR